MHFAPIRSIVRTLRSNPEKSGWYHFTIFTNLTCLDKEQAFFLRDNNFKVNSSLDWNEGIHNSARKTRAKKGSYKAVLDGLSALSEVKFDMKNLKLTAILPGSKSFSPKQFVHARSDLANLAENLMWVHLKYNCPLSSTGFGQNKK